MKGDIVRGVGTLKREKEKEGSIDSLAGEIVLRDNAREGAKRQDRAAALFFSLPLRRAERGAKATASLAKGARGAALNQERTSTRLQIFYFSDNRSTTTMNDIGYIHDQHIKEIWTLTDRYLSIPTISDSFLKFGSVVSVCVSSTIIFGVGPLKLLNSATSSEPVD